MIPPAVFLSKKTKKLPAIVDTYLNKTQKKQLMTMVYHDYGEIWDIVSGDDIKPIFIYPKAHKELR